MSAKRRIEARVSGSFKVAATASASGRLLLQATIFMLFGRQLGSSGRFYAGFAAFYQRCLRLSNWLARLASRLARDHVVDATRRLGGHGDRDVGPVVVERASGNLVELEDLAAFVATRRADRPLDLHPLLVAGYRHHAHVALNDEVHSIRIVLQHRAESGEMRLHL